MERALSRSLDGVISFDIQVAVLCIGTGGLVACLCARPQVCGGQLHVLCKSQAHASWHTE